MCHDNFTNPDMSQFKQISETVKYLTHFHCTFDQAVAVPSYEH